MPSIEADTVAEHRANRERAILAHAVDLLVRLGPAAITPAAVAKATGIARTSVYQYFPSTGDLVAAAVEHLFHASQVRVQDAVHAAGPDPCARLAAYVEATLAAAAHGHVGDPSLSAYDLPGPCRERLRVLHDQMTAPLRAIVVDFGEPDPCTATALAAGAINATVGLVERGAEPGASAAWTVRFLRGALGAGAADGARSDRRSGLAKRARNQQAGRVDTPHIREQ